MKPVSRTVFVMVLAVAATLSAQTAPYTQTSLNKPERLEWLRDQGLGIFIHWSIDSQLESAISHSLVDASPDYTRRFFEDLPKTFYPERFDPDALARLIKVSGARYAVLTTKHHNGFCLFPTETTNFSVAGTPYQRDITGELFTALRKYGIAPGIYFSPDDFHWLWEHHIPIERQVPAVGFEANPGLLRYDQRQMTKLMSHYGKIDVVFLDGEATGLRDVAWKLQPDTVVTRGAITTPEQHIPGAPLEGAWEANLTIGTSWGYKGDHEIYKTGPQLIDLLIQTRARGGNLLINISPTAHGDLPVEEEERLREVGLWMFINGEAIYGTRPWNIANEGNIYFTRKANDLYAMVDEPWRRGEAKDMVLRSVRATAKTEVSVLGQNSVIFEYHPDVTPSPYAVKFSQQPDGLHIHAFRTQRVYDDSGHQAGDPDTDWPNPAVLKIANVEEAFRAPVVHTLPPQGNRLSATWQNPGYPETVQVGFQYRNITGEDKESRYSAWKEVAPFQTTTTPGKFEITAAPSLFRAGQQNEIRAVVLHPLLTVYGEEMPVSASDK